VLLLIDNLLEEDWINWGNEGILRFLLLVNRSLSWRLKFCHSWVFWQFWFRLSEICSLIVITSSSWNQLKVSMELNLYLHINSISSFILSLNFLKMILSNFLAMNCSVGYIPEVLLLEEFLENISVSSLYTLTL